MYPVVPPIGPTQFGPDVQNLQDVMLFLIDKGDIANPGGLSVPALQAERGQSYFGNSTTSWIESFKTQYSIPTIGDGQVGAPTADQLNLLMAQYPEEAVAVSGLVSHTSGNLLTTQYNIRIEQVLFSGNNIVATGQLDTVGAYTFDIPLSSLSEEGNGFAFVLVVEVGIGEEYSSPITYIAFTQRQLQINLLLNNELPLTPEYISVKTKVEALISGEPIKNITYDVDNSQAEYLASNTNENIRDIRNLVIAHQLSDKLNGMNPELFYALLRNNMPRYAEQLLFQSLQALKSAIIVSIDTNIISAYSAPDINNFVNALKGTVITVWNTDNASDFEKTITFKMYDMVLGDETLVNEFLAIFFNFEQTDTSGDFWDYLSTFPAFEEWISWLKAVTVLAIPAGNNLAVVSALLGMLLTGHYANIPLVGRVQGLLQPELLGGLTRQNWISIITQAKATGGEYFIFPEYVEGNNDTQKIAFYANRMWGTVTSIYTIYSVRAQIAGDTDTPFPILKSKLGTFLSNNLGFDLRSLSLMAIQAENDNPYNLSGIGDTVGFIKELATIQRLSALTSVYPAMAAFAADGLVSAFHMGTKEKAEFVADYDAVLGSPDAAGDLYDTASLITTHVIGTAFSSYADWYDDSGDVFEPRPFDEAAPLPTNPYAEWRMLFGSLDSCTCCHCESIFSPSAYLVDTLNFLRSSNSSSFTKLVYDRRPDIKNIELTCDNSNIPVPYIDLVNELLEDMASTGTVFVRQTRTAAEYQRAIPEYMNTSGYTDPGSLTNIASPYTKLMASSYPWSFPYNVYKRQIDTHLGIPGIKGYELLQRFSPRDLINSIDNLEYCTHYLGIAAQLRSVIITASSLSASTYKDMQVHYGLTATYDGSSVFRNRIPDPQTRGGYILLTETAWVTAITDRVDCFLQQTKLNYRELLELMDCFFLNPFITVEGEQVRTFAILNNSSTTNVATCNLFELRIAPYDTNDIPPLLDKLHRFVRLAKALGWRYYDLDIALRAISASAINEASFKKLAQFKYLADSLKIEVSDAAILFQDIETLPYRDYFHEDENCELIDIPNQYMRIFRNPATTNLNLNIPFPPTPFSTNPFSELRLDAFTNFISGITQLKPYDTQLILDEAYTLYVDPLDIADNTITPNLSLLSYIYRQVILLKALKIPAKDWMFFKKWISKSNYFGNISGDAPNNTAAIPVSLLNPFTGSPYTALPFDTIRFVNCARLFAEAGFTSDQLDYLLIDKPANEISDIKSNTALAEMLQTLRSDLLKQWYPDFDPEAEDASQQLVLMLQQIMDEASARRLVDIAERPLAGDPAYTSDEISFLEGDMAFFLKDGADHLAVPLSPKYIEDVPGRYEYIYNGLKNYAIATVLKPLIVSDIAKMLSIQEDSVQVLLNDVIGGFSILLDPAFVQSTADIVRWESFEDQFTVALLLQKAAMIISTFNLGTLDIQYLWVKKVVATNDPVVPEILTLNDLPIRPAKDTAFVPGTNSSATLRLFRNLLQWMQVRAFIGPDINILFSAIQNDSDIVAHMATVFKMSLNNMNTLIVDPPENIPMDIGVLNIDDTLYQTPISYLRIIDCLEMQYLLPASMYTLYRVAKATRDAGNQSAAAEIIRLVKAPYSDKQWLEVVTPVSDALRIERRDALLQFLLAYPANTYIYSWLTAMDIYETLLIDVEMMPVIQTTRILQANNTAQLWMDRVLLQIEEDTVTADVSRQWTEWRKIYRVWEANRKVFIYPENWIEPELRDDKSEIFVELEKFLQQNEVTKDNVEQAYKTYLERLDELSRLDIIGMYRETTQNYQETLPDGYKDTIHAFGRTREQPHTYFYRNRVAGVWSAWEKMNIQIDGDHFVPTVWRGRLRFYWLVFSKDQEEVPMSNIQAEGSWSMPAGVRWKIQLAWSEYKDKKWTAKQLSKDGVYSKYIYEEDPLSKAHAKAYYDGSFAYNNRKWNKKGDLEKLKREGFVFVANPDNEGKPCFSVFDRDYYVNRSALVTSTDEIIASRLPPGASDQKKDRAAKAVFELQNSWLVSEYEWSTPEYGRYTGHIGKFTVRYNGVYVQPDGDAGGAIPSLYKDHDKIKRDEKIDLLNNKAGYYPWNTDYFYFKEDGYRHFPDRGPAVGDKGIQLLTDGPRHRFNLVPFTTYPELGLGGAYIVGDRYKAKYLVFPRKIPEGFVDSSNIAIPYFFHKDNLNTFFVEKVSLLYDMSGIVLDPGTPVSGGGTLTWPVSGGGGISLSPGTTTVKVDTASGTGIALSPGVGLAAYDTVHPVPDLSYEIIGSTDTATVSMKRSVAAYRFHNFTHNRVDDFLDKLQKDGLDGLLDRTFIDGFSDTMNFNDVYKPTSNVHSGGYTPHDKVDFTNEGAYSLYNWELFFHIPMLIANRLSTNQQFADARLWYHYVFNPTKNDPARDKKRFWNFSPFFVKAAHVESVDEIMSSSTLTVEVERWANDPFKPHLIARTRIGAYMKNATMKYLDNLIAWADNLFRTDSREAINEATLLYILAAQILGRRPEQIPARATPEVQTYNTIKDKLSAFGNAMVDVENVLLSSGVSSHYAKTLVWVTFYDPYRGWYVSYTSMMPRKFELSGSMYYFCIPFNENLLQYWDILADRLFKIRNSQSIDGVTRELALFDPPIDPAILVKAAAAGVSLAGVLGDMNAPMPSYRFNIISQKATELAAEVKSLGGQLLSALEKKDAEQIALLRSSQEIRVLEAVTELKQKQIDESKVQWEVLTRQLTSATNRRDHYKRLIDGGLLGKEQLQLSSLQDSIPLQIAQGVLQGVGSALGAIPQAHSTLPGISFGGQHLASIMNAAAAVVGINANINNTKGTMAGINAGYERRKQDWDLQYKLANVEIEQVNKQMIAAEIRFAMAQVELKNHQLQISNAQEMETAMHDKYTNQDLYDWMIGQISFTYFQGYKLAYETAKKAEKSFRYELNLDTSDYIQYGYWDSLKKGLLAGENLFYDLKRMEVAYLELNKRQLELTKNVSLAALNPAALMDLIAKRKCEFTIPEWLYDMDYPGQHMRRIKSVSISIPCVAGPYTTISAKLSLVRSSYRKNALLGSGYPETESDTRFTYMSGNIQSLATSNAQNDSGLFELNFRDERYLPFEGCGAISTWSLELPAAYEQFDYGTISDVILHIRYTAQDTGSLKTAAKTYLDTVLASEDENKGLYRFINLKQEFSNEWYQLLNGTATSLVLDRLKERLPYLVQAKEVASVAVSIFTNTGFKSKLTDDIATPAPGTFDPSNEIPVNTGVYKASLSNVAFDDPALKGKLYLHPENLNEVYLSGIKECWMILHYTLS